jgi:2-polyprenyl-6-methoxyphenol hydroxylase-like FAD-dependent oxidoreductase
MDIDGLRVIVVGAATGGAGAALLLANAGARVTLVERVAEPRAVGAGLGLAENGIAVLDALGLGGVVAAEGRTLDGARVVDARGRVLFEPPRAEGGAGPRLVMIRRSALYGAMLDAAARHPNVTARFGVELVGADPGGRVTLGGGEALAADLVVGADGVRSRVREGGDFGARVSPPGVAYARCLVAPGLARGVEAWTGAGLFGSFPVADATYAFASAGTDATRAAVEARDLDAFRAAWARAYAPSGEILAGVARFDELIVSRVVRVRCRRFVAGRLALVGDAAHAMAPNLGQGANSALVDGAVLLDALRGAPSVAEALDRYDRRRRPAVERVADAAARLGALAGWTHPAARWLRDRALMPLAARLGGDTSAMVWQESPRALAAMAISPRLGRPGGDRARPADSR